MLSFDGEIEKLDHLYNHIVGHFSDDFDKDRLLLAGGAVRDILLGNEPRDLDVFYVLNDPGDIRVSKKYNNSPLDQLKKTKSNFLESFNYKCRRVLKDDTFNDVISGPSVALLGETSIDLPEGFTKDNTPLQLVVHHPIHTQKGIIKRFDFDICCYGYGKDGIVTSEVSPDFNVLCQKMNGELPVDLIHPTSYYRSKIRMQKFTSRFCGIDFDKAKKHLDDVKQELVDSDFGFYYVPSSDVDSEEENEEKETIDDDLLDDILYS